MLADGSVPAVIVAVEIGMKGVIYQVVWWDGRKRNAEWVSEVELTADKSAKLKIGFRTGE